MTSSNVRFSEKDSFNTALLKEWLFHVTPSYLILLDALLHIVDLVTFTEEVLNAKLHFLCSFTYDSDLLTFP